MAAIWKGALAFGLVNVQVKAHAATQDHDISFHQTHAKDGGRIRYKRVCEICDERVELKDIQKSHFAPDGTIVTVTKEELASLPSMVKNEIDVMEFVPANEIDPIRFDRSYYLEPEANAVRPYILLREALKKTDKIAIAQIALRSKTQLAALRVYGDVIVLQTMLWADEVRTPNFSVLANADAKVKPKELALAADLIQSLEAEFTPENYEDEYTKELTTLIDAKLTEQEAVFPASDSERESGDAKVLDLATALQESIDRRSENTRSRHPSSKKSPAASKAKKAAKKSEKKSQTKSA